MRDNDNNSENEFRQNDETMTEQLSEKQESLSRKGIPLKILVLIIYLGMVTANALANILPINGLNTGEVSDSFSNLFAPAGLTFAIWGLIYFLLLIFVIYQFIPAKRDESQTRLKKVQILFVISSIANIGWIFAWHYLQIMLSLVLMLVILVSLILADRQVSRQTNMTIRERLCVKLPFSIYFGWITVATVANVTTLLVDLGWDGFGISENIWTVIILIVAALIALAVVKTRLNWAFGAVFVWAYIGILIKHLDSTVGFGGQYIEVIVTVSICLGLLAAASIPALFGKSFQISTDNNSSEKSARI